ncbi:MAG: FHA domain-containing protein [Candidatus Brocadiia bacterium]
MKWKVCPDYQSIIRDVTEGFASESDLAKLLSHLMKCDGCRGYYSALESEKELLAKAMSSQIDMPADLAERAYMALDFEKSALSARTVMLPGSVASPERMKAVAQMTAALAAARAAQPPITSPLPSGTPSEQPKIVFQLKEPSLPERTVTMEKLTFVVGRSTEADLKIEDPDASRKHCQFEFKDGKYFVKDLESRNGIALNEIKVKENWLASGDIIRLGGTVMKVTSATTAGSTAVSTGDVTHTDESTPAFLTVTVNGKEIKYDITKDAVFVGRGAEVDLRVESDSLSRKHFCIERMFGEFQLVDLGSTNGTLLNGQAALMDSLHTGDRIRIGELEFIFTNPAEKKEEDIVPMGERTIAALMPVFDKPPKAKLDPAVLEAKRARLRAQLEEREASGKMVKIIFGVAAALIIMVSIGIVVINTMNPDAPPVVISADEQYKADQIRKLKDTGKYEEGFKLADQFLKDYPSSKLYAQVRMDKTFCDTHRGETPEMFKIIYEQGRAEYIGIKDRTDRFRDDPVALDSLHAEYQAWLAKYKKRDQTLLTSGVRMPSFKDLIIKAITNSFESAMIRSALKAKDSCFGEAINILNAYRAQYADIVPKYSDKWPEYQAQIDENITEITFNAKEDFEYNWKLAEFYIRENMISDAVDCLTLISEKFGIPEYKKLADEKLASVKNMANIVKNPKDPANPDVPKVVVVKHFEDDAIERLIRRYAFTEALQGLEKLKAAAIDEERKKSIDIRIEEIQLVVEAMDWLIGTFRPNDVFETGGQKAIIKSVDRKGIYLSAGGGEITLKWEVFKPVDVYGMFLKYERKQAIKKSHYMCVGVFCLEYKLRREALDSFNKALTADASLKPRMDLFYSDYSSKPTPKDGFIVYKGYWLTPDEFETVKIEETTNECAAKLDSKDESTRTAALKTLKEIAAKNNALVARVITNKLSDLLEKIKKAPVWKTVEMVQKMRNELVERRKEALKIIFDKTIYPDENHGAVGQPKVDEAVNKVRDIYKTPVNGVLNASPDVKDMVDRARILQEFLADISDDTAKGMIDLDALLENLNGSININSAMDASELRIITISKKIADYNNLLKVGGRRTDEEKKCVTCTNEYRLMMGKVFLRIDRMIVKAARIHSFNMKTLGFFAHEGKDGTKPADRMIAAGYTSPGGENIAKGISDGKSAFEGWYNSSGHHRNILQDMYSEIGLGAVDEYWTQDFGVGGVNVEDTPDNADPVPDCGEKQTGQ